MRKFLGIVFALLAAALSTSAQGMGGKGGAGGKAGFGGGVASAPSISVRGSTTIDTGTITTKTAILTLPVTANAGDLIFIGSPTGSASFSTVACDSTTNATCTSSASTYTATNSAIQCEAGSSPCTSAIYTCNASAGVGFVTVTITGGPADSTMVIAVVAHSVTTGCLDAHPTPVNSASAGSTITSNAFTTASANEIAFYLFSDDNNSGPNWTGTHGTGYTLITVASSTVSMLGAGEYQIFTTTQTGVTASFTTGNSAGHAVATDLFTFK